MAYRPTGCPPAAMMAAARGRSVAAGSSTAVWKAGVAAFGDSTSPSRGNDSSVVTLGLKNSTRLPSGSARYLGWRATPLGITLAGMIGRW
jgi:hypothetical protein